MQIKLDSTLVSPRVLREAQARTAYVLLLLLYLKNILMISVRPIISTPTKLIFTKFPALVAVWPQMNDLKLFF